MHGSNQFIYSRERRHFGRQCLFSDRTQLMLSINPSHQKRLSYILRNPINRSTQLSDQMAYSWVLTENVTLTEHGMNHFEGGWPKEVNMNDEEQTVRHRKKVEREDNWGVQGTNLVQTSLEIAAQNSAINIYQEFFDGHQDHTIRTSFESRQMNIYHDPIVPGRCIHQIDWSPTTERRFMVQHTDYNKDKTVYMMEIAKESRMNLFGEGPVSPNAFYIWDIKNPLKPICVLDSTEPVRRAILCPKDENYIGGGTLTGKVCVWDARSEGPPIRTCPLEAAHRETMTALCWVHSKTNSEFYTGSLDGSIKYWDGRDLETPVHELLLDPEPTDDQNRMDSHGVTVLEFEYTIPVRYIIGSDQGHIFLGNRKGMTPTETLLANYKLFAGPIRTVERNPFFVKNFLIVGDWCAKVWAEECKGSPTTLLVKKKNQLNCGTWSTTRCSLFVTGDNSGTVDFWDLLLDHRNPIFSIKFSNSVTALKFRPDGKFLAVALRNGDIQMMELDDAVKRSMPKDKALVMALFEREQLRSKLLEGRVEEMKLKQKMKEEEEEQQRLEEEENPNLEVLDPNDPDQFIAMIENDSEFKEALNNFKDLTLKVDKKRMDRPVIMERTEFEQDEIPPPEIPEND